MGNTLSNLADCNRQGVAVLLYNKHPNLQPVCSTLFASTTSTTTTNSDSILSTIDGPSLLSLNIKDPNDAATFARMLDALGVTKRSVRQSLSSLLFTVQKQHKQMQIQEEMVGVQPYHHSHSLSSDVPNDSDTHTTDLWTTPARRTAMPSSLNNSRDIRSRTDHTNGTVQLYLATSDATSPTMALGSVRFLQCDGGVGGYCIQTIRTIVLEGSTMAAWAGNAASNATLVGMDTNTNTSLTRLYTLLQQEQLSVYGRFPNSKRHTGVVVLSYQHPIGACRVVDDLHQLHDCPLPALPPPRNSGAPTFGTPVNVPPQNNNNNYDDDTTSPGATPPRTTSTKSPTSVIGYGRFSPISHHQPQYDATMTTKQQQQQDNNDQLIHASVVAQFTTALGCQLDRLFGKNSGSLSTVASTQKQTCFDAVDVWNQCACYDEITFAQLPKLHKAHFVLIAYQVVNDYNDQNQAAFVVRKNTASLHQLREFSIYLNEAAAQAAAMGLYKTKICRYWKRGECVKGDYCPYAHGQDDLFASLADKQENTDDDSLLYYRVKSKKTTPSLTEQQEPDEFLLHRQQDPILVLETPPLKGIDHPSRLPFSVGASPRAVGPIGTQGGAWESLDRRPEMEGRNWI